MAQLKKDFTVPVVCSYDGDPSKEWYIFFRFFHNGKWHSFKRREGINRFHNAKERKVHADELRNARETWLKMGWNPVLDPEFKSFTVINNSVDLSNLKTMSLEKALQFALDKKPLAKKSKQDYGTTVRYICAAARKLHTLEMPIAQLTRVHCKALINEAKNIKNLSNKAYNKNLTFFKSLLSELVEWEALEYNPAFKLENMKEEETVKFIPLTVEERNIIREYLGKVNPHFLLYVNVIYSTGIRPKEILGMQIKDFNEAGEYFHLKPFSEKTKTKKERKVAINPQLLTTLKGLKLHQYNKDYYIFSEEFKPGPTRVERKIATTLWDELVRGHLGIDKYLYCLKHTGADDLIEAGQQHGINNIEEVVQQHLGHTSKFMTRRYTQKGLEMSRKVVTQISPKF